MLRPSLITALMVTALMALCLAVPVRADQITVFAAASLQPALAQIAQDWPATIAYGGSAMMAKQISAGAPADLFISAAPEWMDVLADQGLIQTDTRRDLLANDLVLIAHDPAALPAQITAGMDFAGLLGDEKLAMGLIDAVPAGQYGHEALIHLGLWDQAAPHVVQTQDVRAALALVQRGEAGFGIVYASDAPAAAAPFPADSHRPITYPAALTANAAPEAAAFLRYLSSDVARTIFVAHGFRPLP